MQNLKNELLNLKKSDGFIKAMSIKKLINKYKHDSIRNYNRLKLLLYYFPSIYEDNTIEDIELTLKYPEAVFMNVSADDQRYKIFNDIFVSKYNGNLNTFKFGRYIKVSDVFEHFKI